MTCSAQPSEPQIQKVIPKKNFRSKLSPKTLLAPKPLTISINPKPQTLNPQDRINRNCMPRQRRSCKNEKQKTKLSVETSPAQPGQPSQPSSQPAQQSASPAAPASPPPQPSPAQPSPARPSPAQPSPAQPSQPASQARQPSPAKTKKTKQNQKTKLAQNFRSKPLAQRSHPAQPSPAQPSRPSKPRTQTLYNF